MKKVPLVVYPEGVRTVIGEAVVDISDGLIDITGRISDEEWKKKLGFETASAAFGPDKDGVLAPLEVAMPHSRITKDTRWV